MTELHHEYHLRTGLIAAGSLLLTGWLTVELGIRRKRAERATVLPAHTRQLVDRLFTEHYRAWITLLIGGFFLLATAAKFSQLHASALNAEDFWLFEDMLAQMMRGGFFVTRYAPQAMGWVQHGAVHPMLSWTLALPLAYLFGPVTAALLFGPIVFAAAGATLAAIARPRWGSIGALACAAAFLFSSQVGKILMYDVHPEAAYPLGVFLWAWAAGWGDGRLRAGILLLAAVFTAGIKEDAFVVLLPLIVATWFATAPKARVRPWLIVSAMLVLAVVAFQFYAVRQWSSEAWGPAVWPPVPEGTLAKSPARNVSIPVGAALVKGHHWDTPLSALRILVDLVQQKGGPLGVLASFGQFLFSRPWLSLLILAPWVVVRRTFWVSVLPIAFVYSLLDEPAKFINYYSAPVLGLFWVSAITGRSKKPSILLWLLTASLLLGGGGIDFYRPGATTEQARKEARDLIACLPKQKALKRGVVTGPFIGLVPPELDPLVHSDRVPSEKIDSLGSMDFYLFSTQLASYEVRPAAAEILLQRLRKDPRFVQVGKNCQPPLQGENSAAFLFLRR